MKIRGVELEYLGHSGFLIVAQDGKRIAIDPYNVSDNIEKVDMILVSHSHYDHCSIKDIQKLMKEEGTEIVIPVDCQSKVNRIEGLKINITTVGIKIKVLGVDIYPFFAYNIDKPNHPKAEDWMGYILKLGDVMIYHAGDTDKIPEMSGLEFIAQEGEDVVALLPVSGGSVMNSEEAAEAAAIIKPGIAIPMHYGSDVIGEISDAEKFVELCKEKGIKAEILEKI
ncbi:MAG: MBL fold metallo-hydrolase [Candidatus Pacearchaeota archaeon]|jgi:L-ascorbate metabolism protein UlaG (beta-lactamase superfamily)